VPSELARDKALTPAARGIAAYLWSHAEKFDQSAVSVAEGMGINRRTATAGLLNLEVRGWLIREIRFRPGNKNPSHETWHRQMSNTPFTHAQPNLCSNDTSPCAEDAQQPLQKLHSLVMHSSNASEGMHFTGVQQNTVQNPRIADATVGGLGGVSGVGEWSSSERPSIRYGGTVEQNLPAEGSSPMANGWPGEHREPTGKPRAEIPFRGSVYTADEAPEEFGVPDKPRSWSIYADKELTA
jgi:hypothetical protein